MWGRNIQRAFPAIREIGLSRVTTDEGMSLRDYFAGQALIGLLAGVDEPNLDAMARWAYELADAMMAKRDT